MKHIWTVSNEKTFHPFRHQPLPKSERTKEKVCQHSYQPDSSSRPKIENENDNVESRHEWKRYGFFDEKNKKKKKIPNNSVLTNSLDGMDGRINGLHEYNRKQFLGPNLDNTAAPWPIFYKFDRLLFANLTIMPKE